MLVVANAAKYRLTHLATLSAKSRPSVGFSLIDEVKTTVFLDYRSIPKVTASEHKSSPKGTFIFTFLLNPESYGPLRKSLKGNFSDLIQYLIQSALFMWVVRNTHKRNF